MHNPFSKDMEELVRAGIITADTAEEITRYYQSKKDNSGNKFNTVLGILGALLVGSGLVLVVAHNWDQLSKMVRTIFAFLPLIIGQAICGYTLFKKRENQVWRESSALILFFAMASCIALVSQIYQISGTLEDFIVTWLLLTAPLVYVMNSSLVSLLVIACATWYAALQGYTGFFSAGLTRIPWYYLLFLLFLAPYYYQYAKHRRSSNIFHLHNIFIVISITIALAAFAGHNYNGEGIVTGYFFPVRGVLSHW